MLRSFVLDVHGGANGRSIAVKVSPDPRRFVESHRFGASDLYTESSRWASAIVVAKVVNGILYVLQTGCQWKAMPREFGSGSAIHAYFQEWVELGVFEELWNSRCASTTS